MLSILQLARYTCLLSLALNCSCASYKVYSLPNDAAEAAKVEGIRFNRPWPYILVGNIPEDDKTTGDNVGPSIKVIYLPDRSTTYAIRRRGAFGTAQTTLTLQGGWNLTQFNGQSDSKTAETIDALANVLKAVSPAGVLKGFTTNGVDFPSPGLWRVEFSKEGYISGLKLVSSSK